MDVATINSRIAALKTGERLILSGVPDYIYHATTGIGSSLMAEAVKSMAHYKYALDNERHETPDMMIGTALHTLVLEPEKLPERVIQLPDGIVRGVSQKYQQIAKDHPDKVHLKAEELKTVSDMHAALMVQGMQFFEGGDPEKSYWFKHESGLVLKARIDYQRGDGGIDLKSTRKEDANGFARAVKYDYGIQDALYVMVTELSDLLYVGVSKTPPHNCFAAHQGPEVRELYTNKINEAIKKIAFSTELNDFDFNPLTVTETELTKWERDNL